MVQINSTLKNYSVLDVKTEMFSSLKGFEITEKNIIRDKSKPICPCCNTKTIGCVLNRVRLDFLAG